MFNTLKILDSFSPISLKEMDNVSLMNRTDTKFVFKFTDINHILNVLTSHYKILEIDNTRFFDYTTTYFDTKRYNMYYEHMQGKSNRFKVRHRIYEKSGLSFIEIKFKNNKGRTIKWRIQDNYINAFSPNSVNFIESRVPYDVTSLNPVLINRFTRITLVSNILSERVTLDLNLTFSDKEGNSISKSHIAIAEVKQEKYSGKSDFINTLRSAGIRPMRFSKYCIGSALLNDQLRKNHLKTKIQLINRLEHESHTA